MSTLAERFAAKWRLEPASGCHVWTASLKPSGYGQIRHGGKLLLAHRVAWTFAHGAPAVGLDVCHHCDNPRCVNVEHLFVGTRRDNMQDCRKKGRHAHGEKLSAIRRLTTPRGERCHKSKFTAAQVEELRSRYRNGGTSYRKLAREVGCSPGAIGQLVRRQSWSHIA